MGFKRDCHTAVDFCGHPVDVVVGNQYGRGEDRLGTGHPLIPPNWPDSPYYPYISLLPTLAGRCSHFREGAP